MFKKSVFILTSLFLLIFSQTVVFGQAANPPDIWNPAGGMPPEAQDFVFYGVDFYGISTGCAVGRDAVADSGAIWVTNNGMSWWFPGSVPSLTGIELHDISFADSLIGIAVGSDSTIMKTTDGGNTWTFITSGAGVSSLNGVVMLKHHTEPKNIGWIVGDNGTIIATDDGGNTWNPQTPLLGAGDNLKDVDFVYDGTAYHGMAVGECGPSVYPVIMTADSGATWTYTDTAGGLDFHGVSLNYDGGVLAYFVGENGNIWGTDDWGTSYFDLTPTISSVGDTLFAVEFINLDTGWAVGYSAAKGGIVFHTEDAGTNWKEDEYYASEPKKTLYDVAFTSGNNLIGPGPYGFAVGGGASGDPNKGMIAVYPTFKVTLEVPDFITKDFFAPISIANNIDTTRYKISSFEMYINFDSAYAYPTDTTSYIDFSNSALFPDPSQLFIDTNVIYNSIPGNWDSLLIVGASDTSLSGSGELMRIKFDTVDTAYGKDPQINIFHLQFNEGLPWVTWERVSPPIVYGDVDGNGDTTVTDASLILQFRVNKEPGFSLLQDDRVRQRADVSGAMGVTAFDASLILQRIVLLITDFPVGKAPIPVYDNRLAEFIVSYKESDGSNIIVYQVEANKIDEVLSAELLLSYDNQNLKYIGYELTENTKDFIVETSDGEDGLLSVAMAGGKSLNERAGLISLKFENKGDSEGDVQVVSAMLNESNVETIAASPPNKFSLSQNFPNPFNPETEIRYQIPENTKVVLKIYNILGQEVRTLVDEVKSPGSYNIKWNGKNNYGVTVSTGVYLYRIQAGDFVSTKKLVFLK
ncbi:YCF48-related protein [candidate division KSB1 bacterium]